MPDKAQYMPQLAFYELDKACQPLAQAFGYGVYQVGSSLDRPDYRDVDVRMILADDEYDRMFDWGKEGRSFWSFLCVAISHYLSSRTGLPIDFQIQRQTEANAKHDGKRNAIGIGRPLYAAGGDGTPKLCANKQ